VTTPRALTAIVTGAAGQDGFYLVARLLGDGAVVHATVRDPGRTADLRALPNAERLTIHALEITDSDGYRRLLAEVRPDELYNLAGLSSVRRSFDDPTEAWRTNADAVHGLLEAVRTESPATRFYQSSSTDMFGSPPGGTAIHDESSAFMPQSPYAAAKAAAHVLCDAYRRSFDLRVSCGILSNHESSRRPAQFLTAKVVGHVQSLRAAAEGGADTEALRVGNLAVRREWGFAPDYVDGIVRICRQIAVRADVSGSSAEADVGSSYRDYVLGTGRPNTVWELIDHAFRLGGFPLDWDRSSPDPADWTARLAATGAPAVVVDASFIRHADPVTIGTDPSRARDELAWRPRTDLDTFLADMLAADRTATAPHLAREPAI
jgi:GDPmannose 4,6-dehydratase